MLIQFYRFKGTSEGILCYQMRSVGAFDDFCLWAVHGMFVWSFAWNLHPGELYIAKLCEIKQLLDNISTFSRAHLDASRLIHLLSDFSLSQLLTGRIEKILVKLKLIHAGKCRSNIISCSWNSLSFSLFVYQKAQENDDT